LKLQILGMISTFLIMEHVQDRIILLLLHEIGTLNVPTCYLVKHLRRNTRIWLYVISVFQTYIANFCPAEPVLCCCGLILEWIYLLSNLKVRMLFRALLDFY